MLFRGGIGLSALFLTVIGCKADVTERALGQPCGDEFACASPNVCASDGLCHAPCGAQGQCPEGQSCSSEGVCTPQSFAFARCFGDAADQAAPEVAIDGVGNIILAGRFEGAIDFGGGPLASRGGSDVYLAKLSPEGEHIFSVAWGSEAEDALGDVAVDSQDNILVVGAVHGPVDFGGGTLPWTGRTDGVLVKLDPEGNHLFSKIWGDVDHDEPGWAVAAGANDDILVGGLYSGGAAKGNGIDPAPVSIDFGGGALSCPQNQDCAFLLRLDRDGQHRFSRDFDLPCNIGNELCYQHLQGIVARADGSYLLAGVSSDSMQLDGSDIGNHGNFKRDAFVGAMGVDDTPLWGDNAGGDDEDFMSGIAAGLDGGALIVGRTASAVADFGGGGRRAIGELDGYVASYSSEGHHVFSLRMGGAGAVVTAGVTTAPGEIIVAGFFDVDVSLGGTTLSSRGANDMWIAALDPEGEVRRSERMGGPSDEYVNEIVIHGDDLIIGFEATGEARFRGVPLIIGGGRDACVAKLPTDTIGR